MNSRNKILTGMGILIAASVSGCSSGKPAATATKAAQESPFVEATIEYIGPPRKWAGYETLSIHLSASGAQNAQVTVVPDLMLAQQRMPASLVSPQATSAHVSPDLLRTQLAELGKAVQQPEPEFSECMYPVRVRLVRADGTVLQKEGCRSPKGWPALVSQSASRWMKTAFHQDKEKGASLAKTAR